MKVALHPLKFTPTFHYRIWGGNGLRDKLGKSIKEEKIGESWEISTVPDFVSQVSEGELKGKNLNELIENYTSDLLGVSIYNRFGKEFPLLIKFIDADQPLSVQVHPDDNYAKKHHNSFGKSEMWYIMDAEEEAEIIIGFKDEVDKEVYSQKLKEGKLEEILATVNAKKEEVYYIPAGRVHAIGKGITLAEIQQTSDITYRIYDYNRIDKDGNQRELHTDRALEVSDFNFIKEPRTLYDDIQNGVTKIIENPFFKTSKCVFSEERKYNFTVDSFTIFINTDGDSIFKYKDQSYQVNKGETILIPACIDEVLIEPIGTAEFLMVSV